MERVSRAAFSLDDLFEQVFYDERAAGFTCAYCLRLGDEDEQKVVVFAHKVGIDAETALGKLAAALTEWHLAGYVHATEGFVEKLRAASAGPV